MYLRLDPVGSNKKVARVEREVFTFIFTFTLINLTDTFLQGSLQMRKYKQKTMQEQRVVWCYVPKQNPFAP